MFLTFTPNVKVWTNENRVSSDAQVKEVQLGGLPEGALELLGDIVNVDGKFKLNGVFGGDPFKENGSRVTNDSFDQSQLYYSLYDLQKYLFGLGVNVQDILASRHNGKAHPIVGHANKVEDLNAWYSPQDDDLTFGTNGAMETGQDKWHLASDSDVSVHEAAHLILDHMNKKLSSSWDGDGRAIHEGFGDAMAALYFNDAEMSEDFPVNIGEPESKTNGLRVVDNDLTMKDAGEEEHDKGRVYGGFFWGIKKKLADPNGMFRLPDRVAADITMLILTQHASHYSTGKPKPKDFLAAVMRGVDKLSALGQIPVDADILRFAILDEAIKRKMLLTAGDTIDPPPVVASFAELKKRLGEHITFEPVQKTNGIGSRQTIFQQKYRTTKWGDVNVVDAGVIAEEGAKGKVKSIFVSDVRAIKAGEIDETISINVQAARAKAFEHAKKMSFNAKINMRSLSPRKFKTRDDFLNSVAQEQMNARIADTSMKRLSMLRAIPGDDLALVIIPGSTDLHYEMKVGLGMYYVNAKTGETKFKQDVFVN